MLTITPDAGRRLIEMLGHAPPGVVIRIVFGFTGLRFQYSAVCPGDVAFSHDQRVVLALDRHLTDALSDKTLEMRDSDEGPILDLR
jgi:hypothetical protein